MRRQKIFCFALWRLQMSVKIVGPPSVWRRPNARKRGLRCKMVVRSARRHGLRCSSDVSEFSGGRSEVFIGDRRARGGVDRGGDWWSAVSCVETGIRGRSRGRTAADPLDRREKCNFYRPETSVFSCVVYVPHGPQMDVPSRGQRACRCQAPTPHPPPPPPPTHVWTHGGGA
jgi:hypothetical protein